eukprot:TRINITY_DN1699_c0_g2_i5.p2 TRINITY_DN1699_c0_g2~~TRINITY_DN1699_c0_g2_i5.p2  ORF type:complete len:159 (-),score=21.93 TRINITY_DN1699_c0_g2_i5:104-580(-)
MTEVPRIFLPSWEEFHNIVKRAIRPVVFVFPKAMENDWANTFEEFCALNTTVSTRVNYGNRAQKSATYKKMTPVEYCKLIAVPPKKGELPIYPANTKLDFENMKRIGAYWPPYYPPKTYTTPALWFGPAGSFTPLHIDSKDNLSVQYVGTNDVSADLV